MTDTIRVAHWRWMCLPILKTTEPANHAIDLRFQQIYYTVRYSPNRQSDLFGYKSQLARPSNWELTNEIYAKEKYEKKVIILPWTMNATQLDESFTRYTPVINKSPPTSVAERVPAVCIASTLTQTHTHTHTQTRRISAYRRCTLIISCECDRNAMKPYFGDGQQLKFRSCIWINVSRRRCCCGRRRRRHPKCSISPICGGAVPQQKLRNQIFNWIYKIQFVAFERIDAENCCRTCVYEYCGSSLALASDQTTVISKRGIDMCVMSIRMSSRMNRVASNVQWMHFLNLFAPKLTREMVNRVRCCIGERQRVTINAFGPLISNIHI